jgi:RNA-binding protein
MKEKNNYRKIARAMKPTIQVGKNGINDSLILEIKKQVKKRSIIKIKFLKNFSEVNNVKESFEYIIKKTGTFLVYSIGNTLVISKKKLF